MMLVVRMFKFSKNAQHLPRTRSIYRDRSASVMLVVVRMFKFFKKRSASATNAQ